MVDRQPIVRARTEMKKAKDDKKPRKRVVQAEDVKQYRTKKGIETENIGRGAICIQR